MPKMTVEEVKTTYGERLQKLSDIFGDACEETVEDFIQAVADSTCPDSFVRSFEHSGASFAAALQIPDVDVSTVERRKAIYQVMLCMIMRDVEGAVVQCVQAGFTHDEFIRFAEYMIEYNEKLLQTLTQPILNPVRNNNDT